MSGRHAAERVARADFGNGAFVAIDAAVVADLKKERAVAEPVAALDAFGAPDAQLLVDRVFVIGVFDIAPLDGRSRAQTVFRPRIQVIGFRLEIAGAQLAVSAEGVSMDAFDGGLFQDAVGGAVAAPEAFLRINLPDSSRGGSSPRHHSHEPAEPGDGGDAGAVAQKLAPVYGRRLGRRGVFLVLHAFIL